MGDVSDAIAGVVCADTCGPDRAARSATKTAGQVFLRFMGPKGMWKWSPLITDSNEWNHRPWYEVLQLAGWN